VTQSPTPRAQVLLATLALPGLAALSLATPAPAQAESAPEKTTIALKYGHYQDGQAGWDRITVKAPQLYLLAPVAGDWSVEAALVADSVSGASPRVHSQQSGASRMSDERQAVDVKVTRYLARAAVSASVAKSDERDYNSRAVGLQARWSSDDNNQTWNLGWGTSSDRIDNQYNGVNTAINERKHTQEWMLGLTQVLTPADIAQLNLTRSTGQGYFNDPYKSFDQRPDRRNAWIALARWNHHVGAARATLRSSYRYYTDTFGVNAHTASVEWVQPTGRWTWTPGVRYYSQRAASFYFDPRFTVQGQYDPLATFLYAAGLTGSKSADQRLASYGALTLSIKAAYAVAPDTVLDVKLDSYRQSAALRLGGGGSPGLELFRARFIQLGLTHRF
jgi:hypothetical protein